MKSSPNVIKASEKKDASSFSWLPSDFGGENVVAFAPAEQLSEETEFNPSAFSPLTLESASAGKKSVASQPAEETISTESTLNSVLENVLVGQLAQQPEQSPSRKKNFRNSSENLDLQNWQASEFSSFDQNSPSQNQKSLEEINQAISQAEQLLREATESANDTLAQAQQQAEEMLREAQDQAAQIRQQAYAEGSEAAKNEAVSLLNQLETMINDTQIWKQNLLNQSEADIIKLVISIGKKLFTDGFTLPPQVVERVVGRAVAEAGRLGNLKIYLNPSDNAKLTALWQETELMLNGQHIELVSNQSILPGGCFIEGEFGTVDGRVELQLEQIEQSLMNTLTVRQKEEEN
jgi:flagellar assembly protein FliH